jgi:murein DD-endopeptidase MepM/ murein hydrolase activator NlpD
MSTTSRIHVAAATALAVAAALAAAHVDPAAARPAAPSCGGSRTLFSARAQSGLVVSRSRGRLAAVPPAYGWPVKPFDRQHPVRAFLNDPRIGARGSRAFHFGIDVAAPDGTPVYAVEAGTVFTSVGSVAVQVAPGHEFGYWHIVPVVQNHDFVRQHQLLGRIAPGWGHVHFAERVGATYLNPLRPGGVGPYSDPLAPTVAEISLVHLNAGGVEILANAYDTTWPSVAGQWSHEPVAPALLRWRMLRNGQAGAWQTAADFRNRMLDARLFSSIYAPPTAQNHQGEAGLYCFFLSHAWKPADGSYRIEVAASDTRDNRAVARLDFKVVEGLVRR